VKREWRFSSMLYWTAGENAAAARSGSLDESRQEEMDGIHITLLIVENRAEFQPEVCKKAARQGPLQCS
jgi:hypothetical protein